MLSCPMSLQSYPMDTQECFIELGSCKNCECTVVHVTLIVCVRCIHNKWYRVCVEKRETYSN